MEELASAVKHNVNIILVTKDGSRWPNAKGERICDFPPYDLISQLPEAVRPAFTKKAIAHSDEYYGAFCDTLVARLVPPPASAAASSSDQGGRGSGGGDASAGGQHQAGADGHLQQHQAQPHQQQQ